ncbi:3-oxoacyl-[acyl-carrier protein] reductase [Sinorhizobium terangae]|uniref:SDR family oxidoreductase n=1 Tax=Sinorhizobium terangae TaxID=110322 RepID=A0A6N7LG96_SINTE|nr:SDR family NAD(P)-dependent oxidoreductase [Sinorhizobium terangae]MBB4189791.1 3-oxoacyl-[acyl-carrier protein] reductase [Sinorhizobium terangae]MQX15764.1 SDR family oxidoreductase [Sinorhizobium terangae]
MNNKALAGKVAVVSGGNGGVGSAITTRLINDGAQVAILDLTERQDVSGGELLSIACDVTSPESVERSLERVRGAFGTIQVLVNAAGILGPVASAVEIDVDAWRLVIEANLTSTFVCCKAIAVEMINAGYGRIINIASVQGKEGTSLAGPYAASKAGVIAFTKTLGKELASTGVLVNCITPTAVDTGMFHEIAIERRADMLARIPMGRFCSAHEVAAMTAWLAGDQCSFSTGAVFDLSGGRSSY